MFRRHKVCAVTLVLLVAFLGASCKAGAEHHTSALAPRPTTTLEAPAVTTTTVALPPGIPESTKIALSAVATGPSIQVFTAPGDTVAKQSLGNPTIEGVPLAMLVVDRQGDWLQVRVPERPNNALLWIKSGQVQLSPLDKRVVISTEDNTLRLLDNNQQVIWQTNVATGKPRTPTPHGRFYVDIWLPNPGRPYGAFMLSIAGFSEVYKSFEGGRGQIAMHGWADERVMGTAASNGCVRMRNADIVHLSELVPLGTPVEII